MVVCTAVFTESDAEETDSATRPMSALMSESSESDCEAFVFDCFSRSITFSRLALLGSLSSIWATSASIWATTAWLADTMALPWAIAPSTRPCASVTEDAAPPMAVFTLAADWERKIDPESIAPIRPDVSFETSVCVVPMRDWTMSIWPLRSPSTSSASESSEAASATFVCDWSAASRSPWTESRAPEIDCCALSTPARAFVCASSILPCATPTSSPSASVTVFATVATNVELIVVSSVFAPVSVIFGDTGFIFSFT